MTVIVSGPSVDFYDTAAEPILSFHCHGAIVSPGLVTIGPAGGLTKEQSDQVHKAKRAVITVSAGLRTEEKIEFFPKNRSITPEQIDFQLDISPKHSFYYGVTDSLKPVLNPTEP
jgi:hypothetical protein